MPLEIFSRPLIFVGHPDDESIACGGLLQRVATPLVVFATDGAPAGYGLERKFGSMKAYAELRFQEASRALSHVPNAAFQWLTRPDGSKFNDGHLFEELPVAATSLLAIASLADRLLSKWIAPCRIFHGCTAHCLTSMRAAKQMGALTLVENAACHPRHWEKVEKKEHRRFSVSSDNGIGSCTERLMRRMEREYEACDRIVVPSVVAQQNFVEFGLGEKTVVVQTGVDANFFVPGSTEPPPAFRVCYVGRVELAKGIGYLLEAWKRVGLRGAELVLVGEVKPQMKELLDSYSGCGVRLPGFLPAHEVARCYRESHLFVQPSPNEGLAQALLEAMASGLPVVATDKTGALDCMMNGKEGLIVPAEDANALAGAILWCYQNRDEIQVMGKAARVRIESEFTLEHYNQRVIKLYRNLVSTPRITSRKRTAPC